MEPIKQAIYEKIKATPEVVNGWLRANYDADIRVCDRFLSHITPADRVIVLGDYDCDGINASYIVKKSIQSLYPEKRVDILIPMRREGYGINDRMEQYCIDAAASQKVTVITVDTGITAKTHLENIKASGCTVLLTDHHMLSDIQTLPQVDIVINPSVEEIPNPLVGRNWCGAAVVYQLFAPYLKPQLRTELMCHAGLATVADVITMREGSWQLVHNALEATRQGKAGLPLTALATAMGRDVAHISEDDFGYYLGPAFNAGGRLYDTGALQMLEYLFDPTKERLAHIVATNELRKRIRDVEEKIVFDTIRAEHLENQNPIWVYVPTLHKGIVGILASRVVEEFHTSACVLTNAENGVYTGSARSYKDFDMFAYLNSHQDCFIKMGGHEGAAGFSMTPENFLKVRQYVSPKPEQTKEDYIPVQVTDIPYIAKLTDPLRPFGDGYCEPRYEMEIDLTQNPWKMVGAGKNHLSIQSTSWPKYKILHFYHKESPVADEERFLAHGVVHNSYFKNYVTPEFNVEDAEEIELWEHSRGR